MSLPKVTFQKLDIEENLDSLVWYANPMNSKNSPLNFYEFTLKLFPELIGKLNENMTQEEIYMVLSKEVRPILENLQSHSQDIERYQKEWDIINDAVMKDLENVLKVKWQENEKITCRVGLLPVAPRDIIGRIFDINYGKKKDDLIATAIHELCHFLYFEKWKELYPDYREEEFDNPHIAWYLSEAMIDPLINNATFQKYTNSDLSAYTVFYETYIENQSIIDILREYVANYPIEEAIQKGYILFQKYESIIKAQK